MTSPYIPPGSDEAYAKFQATKDSTDTTAQASDTSALQWVLMKDVDKESGYQTPSPPQQTPEYEGQVVVVPAIVD